MTTTHVHPDAEFAEDQRCFSPTLRVDLSEHPLVELVDGTTRPDRLQVTASQRPGQSPRIEVDALGERPSSVLTAGEAQQLMETLQLLLGQIGQSR
jgi:hypothetical protein